MVSTHRGHGRIVTSCEGMELDLTEAGLHELPESLGIEATTREFQSKPVQGLEATPVELSLTTASQTVKRAEKEFADDRATRIQLQSAGSSDLKIPSGTHFSRKSKRLFLLLVATIIIIVVVVALTVPLALRQKKPAKLYVKDFYSRRYS